MPEASETVEEDADSAAPEEAAPEEEQAPSHSPLAGSIKEWLAGTPLSRRHHLVLGLVLPAMVALVGMLRVRSFTVDDSYISYRYARNFARGLGLVYNEGERIEGYTN